MFAGAARPGERDLGIARHEVFVDRRVLGFGADPTRTQTRQEDRQRECHAFHFYCRSLLELCRTSITSGNAFRIRALESTMPAFAATVRPRRRLEPMPPDDSFASSTTGPRLGNT